MEEETPQTWRAGSGVQSSPELQWGPCLPPRGLNENSVGCGYGASDTEGPPGSCPAWGSPPKASFSSENTHLWPHIWKRCFYFLTKVTVRRLLRGPTAASWPLWAQPLSGSGAPHILPVWTRLLAGSSSVSICPQALTSTPSPGTRSLEPWKHWSPLVDKDMQGAKFGVSASLAQTTQLFDRGDPSGRTSPSGPALLAIPPLP